MQELELAAVEDRIWARAGEYGDWYCVTNEASRLTSLQAKRNGLAASVAYVLDGVPFEHHLLVLPGGSIRVGPRIQL